jgi:hypothetical protein
MDAALPQKYFPFLIHTWLQPGVPTALIGNRLNGFRLISRVPRHLAEARCE